MNPVLYFVAYKKTKNTLFFGPCPVRTYGSICGEVIYEASPTQYSRFAGTIESLVSESHSVGDIIYCFDRSVARAKERLVAVLNHEIKAKNMELQALTKMRDNILFSNEKHSLSAGDIFICVDTPSM